jgi:hypothetical protein
VASGFRYSATTALTVHGVISNASTGTATISASTLSVAGTGRIENIGTGSLIAGTRTAPNIWSSAGTIRATNGRLYIQDGFTNNGTVEASGTGRVTLEDAWANSGTINVSGTARLDLGGTFTTASIGTISRGGGGTQGVIAVTGAWNNTAATYTFSSAGGGFSLEGGTITGGTINPGGGFGLRMGNTTNTLNGVNYTGEVRLDTNASRFRLQGGSTIGGVRVSSTSTGVSVAPGTVVNFPIVIDSNSNIGTFGLDVEGTGTLTLGPSASITSVGTWTGTISLGSSWWSNAATEFINNGTIALSGASRTLTLGGNRFTNSASGAVSLTGGTLTVDVSGSDTNQWTNAGTISVTDGTATFRDQWSVTGTVNATNSTFSLEGRFESPSLLRFVRSGGQMNIAGRLDNTGRTTVLGPTTGTWRIVNGTVVGGTFDTTPTERLAPTNSGGTIENVTFLDELLLDDGSSTRIRILGTTTMPSMRLVSTLSGVSFSNGYVISYPIISDSPVQNNQGIDSASPNATLTIGPGGSISSAPGSLASISVGTGFWSNQTATLNNQGTIDQRALNRGLDISAATAFNNTGTVRVRNGADGTVAALSGSVGTLDVQDAGTTLNLNGTYTLAGTLNVASGTTVRLRGTWGNTGSIAINGGTLELAGNFSLANLGTFTNNGGNVTILGTLDNAAGLTLNAATGSWTLGNGGRIVGGTLSQTQGSRLNFADESTLENVQFTSEMVFSINNGRVRLVGTTRAPSYRLNAQGTGILFPPGHVVNETIVGDGVGNKGVELWGDGTLTLGPSSRLVSQQGQITLGGFWASGQARTLVAQGVVEAVGAGSSIQFASPIFANYDTVTQTLTGGTYRALQGANLFFDGNFIRTNAAVFEFEGTSGSFPNELSRLEVNNGTFTLSGRDAFIINGAGGPTFTNNGSLILGAGSRLTLGNSGWTANFTQGPTGRVRFELGGADIFTGYGSMRVFGTATLDGEIEAAYVNGFPRQCGQVFQVIDANARTGQFATLDLPPLTDETVFLLFYGGADARLTVSARADFNQDGFLDFFDYTEFVECFEGNCPPGLSADFNGDGFVDFFDYLDYVFRFEAGCE